MHQKYTAKSLIGMVLSILLVGYTSVAWANIIYNTNGFSYDVAISGGYAYVADGMSGLKTINISNPDNAYIESNIKFDGETAKTVLVDGNYLYAAFREGGTKIFSLADPRSPILVATHQNLQMDNPIWALSSNLKKVGNILYVGEKRGGLVALDVNDPANPVELGRVLVPNEDYPKEVQGIDISGNYAFVANPWNGMAVIDISLPDSMTVVANYAKPEGSFPGVWDVGVQDDYAYILAQRYGVQVLNVSDPLNPFFVSEYLMDDGRMDTGDSPPADLTFYDNLLFVANGFDGISVFNISDPEILKFVQKIDTYGFACNLEIVGNNLFYADGSYGFGVYDLSNIKPTPISSSIFFLFFGIMVLAVMIKFNVKINSNINFRFT